MNFKNRWMAGVMAVSVAFASTSVVSQRAEAAAGLATGIVPLAVVGGVMAVVGPLGFVGTVIAFEVDPGWDTLGVTVIGAIAGAAMLVVGLILLEDGSSALDFHAVTPAQAAVIGMTDAEVAAFNGSSEELNVIAQEATLAAQGAAEAGQEAAVQAARTTWDSALGGDTVLRSALAKVYRAQLSK